MLINKAIQLCLIFLFIGQHFALIYFMSFFIGLQGQQSSQMEIVLIRIWTVMMFCNWLRWLFENQGWIITVQKLQWDAPIDSLHWSLILMFSCLIQSPGGQWYCSLQIIACRCLNCKWTEGYSMSGCKALYRYHFYHVMRTLARLQDHLWIFAMPKIFSLW